MTLASSIDLARIYDEVGPKLLDDYCKLVVELEPQIGEKITVEEANRIIKLRNDLIRYGWSKPATQTGGDKKAVRDTVVRKYGDSFLQSIFTLVNYPPLGSDEHTEFVAEGNRKREMKNQYSSAVKIVNKLEALYEPLLECCKSQSRYILRNLHYGPWPESSVFTNNWLNRIFSEDTSEIDVDERYILDVANHSYSKDLEDKFNNLWDEEEAILPKLDILQNWENSIHKNLAKTFSLIFEADRSNLFSALAKAVIIFTHRYAKTLPGHAFGRRIHREKDIFARPGEYGGGRYGGQYYDDDW